LSTHISDPKQWILGNTFPFVVFASFGAFWLGFAATLQPIYNAYGAYADPSVQGSTGLESAGFNVGLGKSSFPTICSTFVY
jgi:succinate-acetate transporter protein